MEQFTFFWKNRSPFSNWYPSTFEVEGVSYCRMEQWMMAEKARLFRDDETLTKIMAAVEPKDHKALGRQVRGFNKEKWDLVAKSIVYKGCFSKFNQNPKLKEALFSTGDTTLVEASPVDFIWGCGLAEEDPKIRDRSKWPGLNWLGEVLTNVRNDLRLLEVVK